MYDSASFLVVLCACGFIVLGLFLLLGRLLGWAMGISLIRKELESANRMNDEIRELLTIIAAQNSNGHTTKEGP